MGVDFSSFRNGIEHIFLNSDQFALKLYSFVD